MHALKAHSFDEGVLLFNKDVGYSFGAKESNEQLASEKEGGGVPVLVLQI